MKKNADLMNWAEDQKRISIGTRQVADQWLEDQKPGPRPFILGPLTKQEIEYLRQHKQLSLRKLGELSRKTHPDRAKVPPKRPEASPEKKQEELIQKYEYRFGTVLNADSAKVLFIMDGYEPSNLDSVVKYHPAGIRLVDQLFARWLKTKKKTGDGTVVFMSGGNAAGKSTIAGFIEAADFVFDSTATSHDATKMKIQAVLDNGQQPRLVFVYRPPMDAWNIGLPYRVQQGGHAVPKNTFANTHTHSRKNFSLFAEHFGDRLLTSIYENQSGEDIHEITENDLNEKPVYTRKELLEEIGGASGAILDS